MNFEFKMFYNIHGFNLFVYVRENQEGLELPLFTYVCVDDINFSSEF
jgi:hypothetical protein